MMSEEQYRLEENNQTNELILWENAKILNVFKNSYDNRKHLNILVDKLNDLSEENRQLRKKIFAGLFYNCTLENENDISHLQYIFTLCKLLVDDAIEEVENEDMEYALELAEECIYQFESRMLHFNQDKNGEKRVF